MDEILALLGYALLFMGIVFMFVGAFAKFALDKLFEGYDLRDKEEL